MVDLVTGRDDALRVGGIVAHPGMRADGKLRVGTFADGSALDIPVIVVNGRRPGKVLYVQAACHGVELNGIEVIRRVLDLVDPARLRGALIAVPVANVVAFTHRIRQTHFDLEDMNRVWPGKEDGGMSQRMAHVLFSSAVLKADYLIDLHTGSGTMVTHIRLAPEGEAATLARIFGTELLVKEPLDQSFKEKRFDGKLRVVAERHGIPGITPELGAHSRLQEESIAIGVRGVTNVMKHLAMIDGEPDLPALQTVVSYSSTTQVKANHGGLFVSAVKPGQRVQAGETIGSTYDVASFRQVELFQSPIAGMIVSYSENPVVHFGDSVAMIGRVEEEIRNG